MRGDGRFHNRRVGLRNAHDDPIVATAIFVLGFGAVQLRAAAQLLDYGCAISGTVGTYAWQSGARTRS